MRNFRELKIWQKAFEIASNGFKISASLPREEKYGLRSQIARAGVSIASNIAEGCSRGSDKDFDRFLQIAQGSCFEMETQLLITKKIEYGDQELIVKTLDLLTEEEKMIFAFSESVNKKIVKRQPKAKS